MTQMPERIFAWWFIKSKQDDVMQGGWCKDFDRSETEYVRADINAELLEALEEIADLFDAMVDGEYTPDSFTTQPARAAIARAKGGTQ